MLQQEFDLEGYKHNGASEHNTPNGRLALGLMLSSSSYDMHVSSSSHDMQLAPGLMLGSDAEARLDSMGSLHNVDSPGDSPLAMIERPFRRGVSPKGSAASIDSFGVQRLQSSRTLRSSSVELRDAREDYGGHGGGDFSGDAGGNERTMVRGWSELEEDEQLLSQMNSIEIQDSRNSSPSEERNQAPRVGLTQGQTKTMISLSPRGAGVGLSFESNENGEMVVVGLRRDGPAEKCGAVFIGDTIVAVNGHATIGLSIEEMMRLVRAGHPQSTVRLDVRSPHEHEVRPAFLRQKTPHESQKDLELASTRQLTSQQLQRNEGAGRPAEEEAMKLKMVKALYSSPHHLASPRGDIHHALGGMGQEPDYSQQHLQHQHQQQQQQQQQQRHELADYPRPHEREGQAHEQGHRRPPHMYLPLDSLNLHHQSHPSKTLHRPPPLLHQTHQQPPQHTYHNSATDQTVTYLPDALHVHPRHDLLAHQHQHSAQYPQQPLTPNSAAPLSTARMSEGGIQVRCVPSAPDDFVLHMPTVRGPLAITRTMSEFEMLYEFLIEQYSQTLTKVCACVKECVCVYALSASFGACVCLLEHCSRTATPRCLYVCTCEHSLTHIPGVCMYARVSMH
jgi:hypothetical protein